ncbi:MAG: hypothetical protein LR011_10075 [Verrucomicrobia bacterium]|nr:hypothetical protein [Verrucomicrobiota bacterium]
MERPIQAYEFAAIDFESAGEMTGHTDVPVQVGIALMIGQSILDGQFFPFIYCHGPPHQLAGGQGPWDHL